MYAFIDLHCHTLYGIDDGARNFETTQKMLEIAFNDGIRVICFTPHFKIYKFENDEEIENYKKAVLDNFKFVKDYAKETFPSLSLYLGNEIMSHSDICESLAQNKCLTLNDSKFLLIEFQPNASKFEIESTVSKLTRKGYRPIIAHIERYSAFAKDFHFLKTIKDFGALLQLNASSVTKFKFGNTARLIKRAIKNKLVDILSTDAHNDNTIAPLMSLAYAKIERFCGKEYAKKICCDIPLSIISPIN